MKSRWILVAGATATLAAPGVLAQVPRSAAELAQSGPAVEVRDDAEVREMARRQELIPQILSARETASGRQMSPQLRGLLAGRLARVPAVSLEAFMTSGGLGDIDALVRESVGPRVLGDSAKDLVFTPVTPCRIVNTVATSTPLAANTSRPFYVNGNAAGVFEAQGGNAGGCGIPDTATAVEMNFIAVGPAGPGDLRAFPWAASPTEPLASVINYSNLAGLNIANGLAQPVCDATAGVCTFDLIVKADVATSHVIIDVVGYYNRVDKGPVKSITVFATGTAEFSMTGTCSNFGTLSATITAPVAGKVVLNAALTAFLNHVTGLGFTEIDFAWGTTATACTTGTTFVAIPSAAPSGAYFIPVTVVHTFSVAAGSTTTFFLNSRGILDANISGTGSTLSATFIPD